MSGRAVGNDRDGSSRFTARRAAGLASGALSGAYPNPGAGCPGATGGSFFDDFTGEIVKTGPVSLGWLVADIGGGITCAGYTDTATELGCCIISTAGGAADAGVVYQPQGFIDGLPVGLRFQTKVRLSGTKTQIVATSGFCSSTAALPIVAAAAQFVGVRAIAAGAAANWYFVAKDGAAAGNEDTLDSGVEANETWRIFEMRVRSVTAIDCYLVDASLPQYGPQYTLIGTLDAQIPGAASNLFASFSVGASTAAARTAMVDWHGWGGTIAR